MSSTSMQDCCEGAATHDLEHVDCAIIIVTYNSSKYIASLLDSLPPATNGLRIRCIVVDNNSQDETMSIVSARDDAMAIQATRNLGYAGAINLGRSMIGPSSSLLILNPDLTLESGSVVQMYQALEESEVGVSVPMLLNHDGTLYMSLRREPTVLRSLGEAIFGAHMPKRPGWMSETIRDPSVYKHPQNVTWAAGATILMSAACNDAVGDWDDGRFFLYAEETDFAVRARNWGYRIRYVPTARVRHYGGGSGRSAALGALMGVSRVRYYEKYHSRPATSLFRAAVTLRYVLRSADASYRTALGLLIRRSRWSSLPGGAKQ